MISSFKKLDFYNFQIFFTEDCDEIEIEFIANECESNCEVVSKHDIGVVRDFVFPIEAEELL